MKLSLRAVGAALLFSLCGLACAPAPEEAADEPATTAEEQEDELISDPPGKAATESQLPADYERRDAKAKQDLLWKMVSTDEYCGAAGTAERAMDYAANGCLEKLPTGGAGYAIQAIKSLFRLNTTFDRSSDELPKGRHKIFHPFGSVAKAQWVPAEGSPYTGMLASGAPIDVIVRLAPGGGGSLIPGIATKFLVDGQPSVNTMAIQDFDGSKDPNYFHAVPSNVVPPAKSFLVRGASQIFKIVKSEPNHLQLTHLASITPRGASVAAPRTPYQIQYRPHAGVAEKFGNERNLDFRVALRDIPPGTVIYDVYARPSESDPNYVKIAEIKTGSWIVASGRGDYQLFFRHFRGTN